MLYASFADFFENRTKTTRTSFVGFVFPNNSFQYIFFRFQFL